MKITDYMIVTGKDSEALRQEVLQCSVEGWEVYGSPLLLQKPVQLMQAMVKKFDPHAGKVFVRIPGKQGHWMDPEEAALARQS